MNNHAEIRFQILLLNGLSVPGDGLSKNGTRMEAMMMVVIGDMERMDKMFKFRSIASVTMPAKTKMYTAMRFQFTFMMLLKVIGWLPCKPLLTLNSDGAPDTTGFKVLSL